MIRAEGPKAGERKEPANEKGRASGLGVAAVEFGKRSA